MTLLISLPVELQSQVLSYLYPREHYRYARTSRANWELLRREVEVHKYQDTYGHITLLSDDGDESNLDTAVAVIQSPSNFEKYTTILSIEPNLSAAAVSRRRKQTPNLPTNEHMKEAIYYEAVQQDPILKPSYVGEIAHLRISLMEGNPSLDCRLFLLRRLPNLRHLYFENLCGDDCTLPKLLRHNDMLLNLTHVYLRIVDYEQWFHYNLVHEFALLPNIIFIKSWGAFTGSNPDFRDLRRGASNAKELEFVDALIDASQLGESFSMFSKMKRLHYHGSVIGESQLRTVITIALLCASQTLLSLRLAFDDNYFQHIDKVSSYISLTGFQTLEILYCDWRDILPTKEDFTAETQHLWRSNALSAILPNSLVLLSLIKTYKIVDNEVLYQISGLMGSGHPRLRNIQLDCSQELLEVIRDLGAKTGIEVSAVHSFEHWLHTPDCECGLAAPYWTAGQPLPPFPCRAQWPRSV